MIWWFQRPNSLRSVFFNMASAIAALGLVACGNQSINKSVNSNSSTTTTVSGTGTGGNGSGVTSNGGVECGPDNFCVNIVPPTDTTMILHQDGNYSQPCIVLPGSDTACILEAQELDLWDAGMTLSYNVPSGMCSYFNLAPYFYYQYQPGFGPTVVNIHDDQDTGVITESDSGGFPSVTSATAQAVVVAQPYSDTPTCSADYTANGGPNCCYGQYQLNLTTTISGVTTTTTSIGDWGGNPNNCFTGPAMDTQTLTAGTGPLASGYPLQTITALDGNAISGTYTVKAPIKRLDHSNVYIANYWQSGTTGSYPFSSAPNAMQGPGGGFFYSGNPWYEFDCLDPAQDFVARIRVMVRSWSSNAQFQNMITTQNGTPSNGSYNLYGTEPSPFGDQPILDRETWVTPANSSGTYATQTSGVSGAGAANAPCFTSECGFGTQYPGFGN